MIYLDAINDMWYNDDDDDGVDDEKVKIFPPIVKGVFSISNSNQSWSNDKPTIKLALNHISSRFLKEQCTKIGLFDNVEIKKNHLIKGKLSRLCMFNNVYEKKCIYNECKN